MKAFILRDERRICIESRFHEKGVVNSRWRVKECQRESCVSPLYCIHGIQISITLFYFTNPISNSALCREWKWYHEQCLGEIQIPVRPPSRYSNSGHLQTLTISIINPTGIISHLHGITLKKNSFLWLSIKNIFVAENGDLEFQVGLLQILCHTYFQNKPVFQQVASSNPVVIFWVILICGFQTSYWLNILIWGLSF